METSFRLWGPQHSNLMSSGLIFAMVLSPPYNNIRAFDPLRFYQSKFPLPCRGQVRHRARAVLLWFYSLFGTRSRFSRWHFLKGTYSSQFADHLPLGSSPCDATKLETSQVRGPKPGYLMGAKFTTTPQPKGINRWPGGLFLLYINPPSWTRIEDRIRTNNNKIEETRRSSNRPLS